MILFRRLICLLIGHRWSVEFVSVALDVTPLGPCMRCGKEHPERTEASSSERASAFPVKFAKCMAEIHNLEDEQKEVRNV